MSDKWEEIIDQAEKQKSDVKYVSVREEDPLKARNLMILNIILAISLIVLLAIVLWYKFVQYPEAKALLENCEWREICRSGICMTGLTI